MREIAKDIFLATLRNSSVAAAFRRHIEYTRGALRIGEDLYPILSSSPPLVVAFGKAAPAMVEALAGELGGQAGGIVVTPAPVMPQLHNFRYFLGGHPTPNAESIRAGDDILRSLASAAPGSLVIFLISGGGSAMVERPIDDDISLDDLVETYRLLVLSGAPIVKINAIRKHLSAIKGGRLAQAAAVNNLRQVSIMISDVPCDALDSLASGPTMPDSTTAEDSYAIAAEYQLVNGFPASVRKLFERRALEETPKHDDPAFVYARWCPILSSDEAQKNAAKEAESRGFTVVIDSSCDDWEYDQAAEYLLRRLRDLRTKTSRACVVSGGEVTVRVSGGAGIGGRNQQFALYCAPRILGENIAVLSAGTDGIDGNSPAAGAVVDGATMRRAEQKGFDPQRALDGFNSHPLFKALDDDVTTGPTGNNVRDLRVLLAW